MFWLAGTWRLPFFWAVLAVQLVLVSIGINFIDRELFSERLHPAGKDADPFGRLVLTVLFLLHFGLAALDVGRLHIADFVPVGVQFVALTGVAIGWAGFLWAMAVNRFFSSAIRLQPERGQQVITTGPYKWIRHPGYAFAALAFLSQAPALGSWLALVPDVPLVLYLVYRTLLEERLLTGDLAGYREYSERVRYRWVPGVW